MIKRRDVLSRDYYRSDEGFLRHDRRIRYACDRFVHRFVHRSKGHETNGEQKAGKRKRMYYQGTPLVQFRCSRSLDRAAKPDGNARPTMMIDECRARHHYMGRTTLTGWIRFDNSYKPNRSFHVTFDWGMRIDRCVDMQDQEIKDRFNAAYHLIQNTSFNFNSFFLLKIDTSCNSDVELLLHALLIIR